MQTKTVSYVQLYAAKLCRSKAEINLCLSVSAAGVVALSMYQLGETEV